jgi:peptidoglycan/LPS O-acetylase OafA/YrhL
MPVRQRGIDWMRSLSILYIVGFWHLLGYEHFIDHYKNAFTGRVLLVVLGLFIFLSGHLAARSSGADFRPADGLSFYRRRLLRIYPPYLLALLWFQASGLLEHGQLVESALLLSALTGNTPRTLWYITVLMVYMALAPALLLLCGRNAHSCTGPGDGRVSRASDAVADAGGGRRRCGGAAAVVPAPHPG